MKSIASRVVPTLTEVLEPPQHPPLRQGPPPQPPSLPSQDEIRQMIAEALATGIEELRAQLQSRIETLVREALDKRLQDPLGRG